MQTPAFSYLVIDPGMPHRLAEVAQKTVQNPHAQLVVTSTVPEIAAHFLQKTGLPNQNITLVPAARRTSLHALVTQAMAAASTPWVSLILPGHEATANTESHAELSLEAHHQAHEGSPSLDLILESARPQEPQSQSPTGGSEEATRTVQLLPPHHVVEAVFGNPAQELTLAHAMLTTELLAQALELVPANTPDEAFELTLLFALCCASKGAALILRDEKPSPSQVASQQREPLSYAASAGCTSNQADIAPHGNPPHQTGALSQDAEPQPELLSAAEFAAASRAASAPMAVARVISRADAWDTHRASYWLLIERLLDPLLERFPYSVAEQDRAAAFDALVADWPAAELVSGLARVSGDRLLQTLEAAHMSQALAVSACTTDHIQRIALLCPPSHRDDLDDMAEAAEVCRLLGMHPKVLLDLGIDAPEGQTTVLRLPACEAGESYRARAQYLTCALREHGADAIAAPMTSDASLTLDLLLARLMGIPVLLVAPPSIAPVLGTPRLQKLMQVAQTASVIGVPSERGGAFWRMASHARVVVLEADTSAEEFWSQMADALEARPEVFSPEVAGCANNGAAEAATSPINATSPLGGAHISHAPTNPAAQAAADQALAQERIRMLEEQTAVLKARLAAAHDEARILRERLVQAGNLPSSLHVPNEPPTS